jgi:hypothetical protein
MLRWTLINGKTVDNVLHGIVSGGVVANSALAQAIYAHIIASAAWTCATCEPQTGRLSRRPALQRPGQACSWRCRRK